MKSSIGTPVYPNSPLTGTSPGGTAVTGESNTGIGVLGVSIPASSGSTGEGNISTIGAPTPVQHNDGVYGEGNNGVHGMCNGSGSGVLGEGITTGVTGINSGSGPGVSGTSVAGHGVTGVNGSGSGTKPGYGCGVWGDSDTGYGVFGSSKTASAIKGVGPTAGEFIGNVSVTGNVAATNAAFAGTLAANKATLSGTLSVSGNISGSSASFSGAITANDVILTGQDCAEDFDIAHEVELEPGTVVVFDEEGAITKSDKPYNKRVVGVISGAGNYRPGVILGRQSKCPVEGKAPVALMGRVYCKVDASYGPIEVGDLLTTSPTLGCAMKATNPMMAFGAVIGKALSSQPDGQGLIPILVTLQ